MVKVVSKEKAGTSVKGAAMYKPGLKRWLLLVLTGTALPTLILLLRPV